MDEKMKAAFDAKWPRQYGCNHRYYGRIAIDWALKYLSEKQAPVAFRFGTDNLEYIANHWPPLNPGACKIAPLYAGPVPEEPSVSYTTESDWPPMPDKFYEAIGWMHAECCAALDRGEDPRKMEVTEMVRRCIRDLTRD